MALITTTTLQILKFNQAQKMYKAGSKRSGFLFARIMTAQNAKKHNPANRLTGIIQNTPPTTLTP